MECNEHGFEKKAFSSKKFIAYMVAEIGWKAIIIIFILTAEISLYSATLMMGVVIISGFVQVGYILGQAGIDKYIRVAQINSQMIPGSKFINIGDNKSEDSVNQ